MNNIFLILFIIVIFFLFIEITLRYKKLIYMPLKFKILYCIFLLGKKTIIESYVICQRVHRGGFKSVHDLMQHYSKITNLSINQIYKKFIPNKVYSDYYSGAHGLVNETFDPELGFKAIPDQKLQTVNINEYGLRQTINVKNISRKKEKKIIFLGGSVMFGFGSTGDEKTIPSSVSRYLNNNKNTKFYYKCYNYGYFGDDSFKEAIKLAKIKDKPSIIISLGGFSDIINKIWGKQDDIINRLWGTKKSINSSLYNFLKQFLIFRAIKRFFLAYKNYDLVNDSLPVQSHEENDIYPLY